jgi:tetratricopeptide (TPR) repeat protein
MLTLEEHTDLLVRAAELHQKSAFGELVTLLSAIPRAQLVYCPDLGYLLVQGYYRTNRYEEASELNGWLIGNIRGQPFNRLYSKHLVLEGALRIGAGELEAAEAILREAIRHASRAHDHWVAADVMMNLGVLGWIGCRWDDALEAFQRALTEHTLLGRPYSVAACHQNLAMTYREMNRFTESDSHFEKAFQLYSSMASSRANELSLVESERALLLAAMGDHGHAEALARRAFSRVADHGALHHQAEVQRVIGVVLATRGALDEARACLMKALTIAEDMRTRLLEAEVCEALASVARQENDSDGEARWAAKAAQIYMEIGAEVRSQIVARRHDPTVTV